MVDKDAVVAVTGTGSERSAQAVGAVTDSVTAAAHAVDARRRTVLPARSVRLSKFDGGRCSRRQCDGGLSGVAEERQCLVQIETHRVAVVAQVADRYVGAQPEVEIAAAGTKTKAPSMAGAQMMSPSMSLLRCSRIG